MKHLIFAALVIFASISFGKAMKSRNPASAETSQCQTQAGDAAVAAVRALGQDVTLETIKLDIVRAKFETYKVHLKGDVETLETTKPITVKVTANDQGCGLRSIEMPMVIFE